MECAGIGRKPHHDGWTNPLERESQTTVAGVKEPNLLRCPRHAQHERPDIAGTPDDRHHNSEHDECGSQQRHSVVMLSDRPCARALLDRHTLYTVHAIPLTYV